MDICQEKGIPRIEFSLGGLNIASLKKFSFVFNTYCGNIQYINRDVYKISNLINHL